jgi:hypothetical protein
MHGGVARHKEISETVFTNMALYNETHYTPLASLQLVAGLRVDKHSRTGHVFSAKGALVYMPNASHSIKLIGQSSSNNGSADNYEFNFDEANRSEGTPMSPGDSTPREHRDLRWDDSSGPGYTPAEGEERARSRYEAMRRLMPYSIPRLMGSESVRATCAQLRDAGWKDWHILQALTSIVMSFRLSRLPIRDYRALESAGRRMSREPEQPDDPTPPAGAITTVTMRDALRGSMLVTVRSWELSLRQETPDFPALDRLLGARFGFWGDDAPHERWWDEPSSEASG